jgi:hypothetical protein
MAITSLNNVNQLILVMVKCGVLFEVRTGFLNIISISFVLQRAVTYVRTAIYRCKYSDTT